MKVIDWNQVGMFQQFGRLAKSLIRLRLIEIWLDTKLINNIKLIDSNQVGI